MAPGLSSSGLDGGAAIPGQSSGERLALADAQGGRDQLADAPRPGRPALVALGLVHLERPGARITALTLFSPAVVTTLVLIAVHERPFDGPLALSPEPLRIPRLAIPAVP